MDLNTPVIKIKGIGEKTSELLSKLSIETIDNLIHYYPRSYDKYENIALFRDAKINTRGAYLAIVKSNPKVIKAGSKIVVSFFVADINGDVAEVRFFNAAYLAKTIKLGEKRVFRGVVRSKFDKLIILQPKMYQHDEYINLQGSIVPIYPLIKDLSNEKLKKAIYSSLSDINFDVDYLTKEDLDRYSFLDYKSAIRQIHFPDNENSQYLARRRIIFEEFVDFLSLSYKENSTNKLPNSFLTYPVADLKRLEESLPYELTNAQKNAITDIVNDLESEFLMNRVIQGDVGSGKTIVAIMALLYICANNYQGAMMAPTEVLAKQHFESIKSLKDKYNLPIKPVFIAGKMPAKEKKAALNDIKTGNANVIIGTHAIFQEAVEFNNLALVITDEQHRFGVKQREAFKNKGNEPHILVMSATPIPRTLAMIVFGGQSVSLIDELPKSRIPISNCVVNNSFREKAYEKIRSEISKGHQAYIICPMVSENDESELELKSVEEHSKDVKDYFGENIKVATLTGKMKSDEKTRIMEDFKNKKYDILVATTVIEVGIDVPNATIIMIENSERFGLSTLHQLRGRVGRGSDPSFCILMSDSTKEQTLRRLKILNSTNDGFKIAEEDMKLRGPGELNGVRQSGELSFGLADLANDSDVLLIASKLYDKYKGVKSFNSNGIIDYRTI